MAPSGPDMLMWPMRRPVFVPDALNDHLVVLPERAVHQEEIGAGDARAHSRIEGRTVGEMDEPPPAGLDLEPQRVAVLRRRVESVSGLGLEIERQLARDEKWRDPEAQALVRGVGEIDRLVRRQSAARDDGAVEHLEDRVAIEHGMNTLVRIECQGRALAQMQEPGDGIDVAVGEDDGGDRRRAQAVARVESRVGLDLLAQVRAGVDDHPALARRR